MNNLLSLSVRVPSAGLLPQLFFAILCSFVPTAIAGENDESTNWYQGSGPAGNFSMPDLGVPTRWSLVKNRNIKWSKVLPETGQSTVTVWNDRVFFTTLRPVQSNAALGKDIEAWCSDVSTGKTIWKRTIQGEYPLRLSGCFSDSSAPPPVTDGEYVVFFNSSGTIACFDLDGNPVWERDAMAVGRSQPFVVGNNVVFTRQHYMPDEHGHFTHEHSDEPVERWTQLQALELRSGKIAWTTRCGVNMGSVPLPYSLPNGRRVAVVGRGGGHAPPEKPEGISLVDLANGNEIWTLPLEGFMSTMTHNVYQGHVLVFHDDEHLWVDVSTGKIERRVNFLSNVLVHQREGDSWSEVRRTLPPPKKKRAIIQQSNILADQYHYFRSYARPYLGRVNVESGLVEYLQLPIQLKRQPGDQADELLWDRSEMEPGVVASIKKSARKVPKQLGIEKWCFVPNDMLNSRGFEVMGDVRSRGGGWGHHASQVPSLVGNKLFLPIMNGTVFVIDANSEKLDQRALIAINDLGAVGESFNRASISVSGRRLFAHSIKGVVCIEEPTR